jgi:ATP-dependent RNA helicase DDX46/PRP5
MREHRSHSSRRRYDSYSSEDSYSDDDRHRSSRHSSSSRRKDYRDSRSRSNRTPESSKYRDKYSSDSRRTERKEDDKTYKRKAEDSVDTVDLKRQKLEAWKQKVAKENLINKLKQEKEKIAAQKSSTNGISLNLGQKKITPHVTANVFADDDTVEVKKEYKFDDEEDAPTSTIKTESQDDVDPLDAFMNGINDQVSQLPNFTQSMESDWAQPKQEVNYVTLEDIQTIEPVKSENQIDYEDENVHKSFVEALKKKVSEEPAYHVLSSLSKSIDQELESTEKDVFMEDEDNAGAVVDDYLYVQGLDTELPTGSLLDKHIKANKKDLKPIDHSKIDYPEFRKNFFIIPKELRNLTEQQIKELRREAGHIRIRGKDCPPPIKTWSQCGLNDTVLNTIKELGYKEPFPIQKQAIPCIMMGRNVIGIAKTGSGKTLAFILPMFRHIMDQRPLAEGDGPIAVIIAPTRELAMQIHDDIEPFAKALDLLAVCAYGGASIAEQIASLKRGAHIIVCTPGRMIDLLCANRGRVTNLTRVTYVVMDEADRMFDMGFGPQISRIVDNIRPDRQIVLFSATFPKPLEALAKKFLQDSIEIIVGGRSIASNQVKQYVEIRTEESKFLRLLELLGEWNQKGNILVFVDTQNEVGNLFKDLVGVGYGDQVASLHGGMEQLDRDDTLALFKSREKTILIATSVAARGLHVEHLQLVINYNVPNHYEDYVHRVGRTGRAGKEGTSYTFITPDEERYAPDMVRALKMSGNRVPDELAKMADNFEKKRKNGLVDNKYPHQLSGYVGSGFKFDNNELNAKKKEMVRQLKSMGMEGDELVSELIETEEELQKTDENGDPIPVPATPTTTTNDNTNVPIGSLSAVLKSQQLFKEKASNQQKNTSTAITPGINAMGVYEMELEINDYPQQARYRVTHRDALYDIQDVTGASVTCKGIYVDAGRPVPPGERKLYLLIEAPDQESVKRARLMIVKRLEEASNLAVSAGLVDLRRPAGRFTMSFK